MKTPLLISVCFLLLLVYNSCIDPIDFKTPENLQILIVDGQITNSGEGDFIKLSRTSQTNSSGEPVINAQIKIVDDSGREEFLIPRFDISEGTYQHRGEVVVGKPGSTYFVEIILQDGETYRSVPERMPSLNVIDSAYLNYTFIQEKNSNGEFVERKVVQLYTDFTIDPNTPIYLKWDLDEAFQLSPTDFPDPFGSIPPPCYITNILNPSDIHLFNGSLVESDKIHGIKLANRILDYAFLDRYYFNIKLTSITPEAYEYWEKVNRVVNNVGTVFDSPPAPIKGNIYNINNPEEQVLGYFNAASVKISHKRIIAVDIPNFIPPYCKYNANTITYPGVCLDCLTHQNSSFDKPEYF